jgi:hypothetical protein
MTPNGLIVHRRECWEKPAGQAKENRDVKLITKGTALLAGSNPVSVVTIHVPPGLG